MDGYIPGEEEAEDYVPPENDTPNPVYIAESGIADEDAVRIPKGIHYVMVDNVLKVNTGLNGDLSAWAIVYSTEPEKSVEFKYNANGLRVQREFKSSEGTTTTDYTLHGKLITHQLVTKELAAGTKTTDEMHFFYDAQSRPAMVEFNGAFYTYVHNLQGDIIGIVDNVGTIVVEYGYDAWGNPLGEPRTDLVAVFRTDESVAKGPSRQDAGTREKSSRSNSTGVR